MRGANASSSSGSAPRRLCVLGKPTQISSLGEWVTLGPAGAPVQNWGWKISKARTQYLKHPANASGSW